jgi:hypothetical protein
MASDADRNNHSNKDNDQPKQENPFIKFRQFADSHIGSLLQGIIGLPSAFSKNPGANARWADFDEDLRRRDELKARQQQLRDADVVHQDSESSGQAGNISARLAGSCGGPDSRSNEEQGRELDSSISGDVPLYSPVHKSLFNHLKERGDNEPDWKPSNFMKSLNGSFLRPEYWPLKLRSEQASPNVMETIKYLAYNELNSEPIYCAEYSLLPYLLFSSYSPLKLSVESQTRSIQQRDTFEYCAAFEDLIRTTSGQPLTSPPLRYSVFHGNPTIQSSLDGMSWIQKLYGLGLLQQRSSIDLHEKVSWPGPWSRPIWSLRQEHPEEANTELEMYDRFLRSLSSAAGHPGSPADDIFASIFKEGEASIQRLFKDLDSPESRKAIQENVSSIMKDVRQFRDALLAAAPEFAADDDSDTEPRTKSQDEVSKPSFKPVKDPSRVVSSSTTTEHHTNEDGSAEVIVTVWKRFADGRESCTTTSHCEDAPSAYNEEYIEKENLPKQEERKPKTGWFWN